jgi:CRISPR/Cas system CSM-associated protein Csm3 (group 7 of RAMP superfamily)
VTDVATAEEFMGRIASSIEGDVGHASFLTIDDAIIDARTHIEIRDGVGIDREDGTAADGIKFDREVLPQGTKIQLSMRLDQEPNNGKQVEALLGAILETLRDGDIKFGGAKSRGLGKVRLVGTPSVTKQTLGTRSGLLDVLRQKSPVLSTKEMEALSKHVSLRTPRLRVSIKWRPTGALMVKASRDGEHVDILPLVSRTTDGNYSPVLPGSGLKGAIRSQAERILATLFNPAPLPEPDRFLASMNRFALAQILFGAPGPEKESEVGSEHLGGSAIAIDDVYCSLRRPRIEWDNVANGQTPAPIGAATHVAIDRWTGGAADGFLYTAAEPVGLQWQAIEIAINPQRLLTAAQHFKSAVPEQTARAAIGLLILTLRDVADGLVPLGFGVTRGYGDIHVEGISITYRPGAAIQHKPANDVFGALAGIDLRNWDERLSQFETAWTSYVATGGA